MPNTPELSPLENESLNQASIHDQIALRAYELYSSRGYLNDSHLKEWLQDWLQAEHEVLRQHDLHVETALTPL